MEEESLKEIEFPSPMADLAGRASLVIHSNDLFGEEGKRSLADRDADQANGQAG